MANTKWKHIGSNIEDIRTEDEKKRDKIKAFKSWMAIDRMKTAKPKFKKMPKRTDPTKETEE